MNRKDIKTILESPVLKAFSEGRDIIYCGTTLTEVPIPDFVDNPERYTIAPLHYEIFANHYKGSVPVICSHTTRDRAIKGANSNTLEVAVRYVRADDE